MDHQIQARRPDLFLINKKKRNCRIVYFTELVDYKVKVKESKKLKPSRP